MMLRYKADIAGGALKVYESRLVAGLLLNKISAADWRRAIEIDNILQKKSPATARRQASLIRARLLTMTPDLWQLVKEGSKPLATQAVFAAALAHSPLLRDFLLLEVRDHFRSGNLSLTRSHWRSYLDACHERDPEMPAWTTSTAAKLGDTAFQILLEIGMLSDGDRPMLQPVYYQPEVLAHLNDRGCSEILRAMQVFI